MRWQTFLSVLCGFLGGCGGQYILTVPDQLAAEGGDAVAVVRLQRSEFYLWAPPSPEAAMRFRVGQGPLRAAYTDKRGYAGTTVAVPSRAGRHEMIVSHLDREGTEVQATVPVYVWDTDLPALAVELDALPLHGPAAREAAPALSRLAKTAHVLYLTRQATPSHARLHEYLAGAGYPDGPILLWRRQRWRVVRDNRFNLPRVIVDSHLVSQLREVVAAFPNLRTGIAAGDDAAEAFVEAGLKCLVVGKADVDEGDLPQGSVIRHPSWEALSAAGL